MFLELYTLTKSSVLFFIVYFIRINNLLFACIYKNMLFFVICIMCQIRL